jgi:iron complex outermembrane receptor protein
LDDALVYGHISTGYRAGSFNAEFTATQDAFTSLKPEHLTAYEVGFKTSLASRVLQMNGAFFRYDFKDGFLNVNLPNSVLSVVTNAAAIRSTGAELDLKWRAGPGLQLDLNAGWLDARIKSDVALGTESLKGNRPVNAPKWTFGAGAFYKMPLTDTVNLEFGANGNYKSSQYMSTVNRPSNQQDGFWVVNAQLALADRDSRWRLSGWVRNLTNARYRTFVNDVPGYGVLNIFGRPRVYGVTGSFEF